MKSRYFFALLATAAIIMMGISSCSGSKRDGDEAIDEQTSQLNEALQRHDIAAMSVIADSMALYVDDLTPDETVAVLLAFLEIHNNAVRNDNSKADLEVMRKYVDVFDIATGNNPNDMRAAFERARETNGSLDFERDAETFRRALADYDARSTYGDEPEPEPAKAAADSNSTATDSVAASSEAVVKPID